MEQPLTDGRRARSERTRQAVLDSIVDLIQQGELPTTAEVASRAGISERSLFRHFESRDVLFDAAIDRLIAEVIHLALPVAPDGSVEDRLEQIVAVRAPLFEAITPMRRTAPLYARRSARVVERMHETRRWFRQEVGRTFAPELAARTGADRRQLHDALDLALSWEAWDHLRQAGTSVPRARRLLVLMASSVLERAPSSG